jgi:hypothetical protein
VCKLPCAERRQEPLERLLVADEIVVDKIDMAAIAEPVECIEFGEHLLVRLCARYPAIQLDDVAELTIERTAAGELDADIDVMVEIEQIEPRRRTLCHVGLEFLAFEYPRPGAVGPRRDQLIDQPFGFTEHQKVRVRISLGARHGVGTADHDRLAVALAQRDDGERIFLLRQHPARHDEIGPRKIGFAQLLRIAIDEAEIPGRRQQGCERDQPERRRWEARAPDVAQRLKIPERVRIELGKHQESVRGFPHNRLFQSVAVVSHRSFRRQLSPGTVGGRAASDSTLPATWRRGSSTQIADIARETRGGRAGPQPAEPTGWPVRLYLLR